MTTEYDADSIERAQAGVTPEAIQAFQLAEQAFGERMQARGVLFDPALGVEAGLLAALPHLAPAQAAQVDSANWFAGKYPTTTEPAQPSDSGRVPEEWNSVVRDALAVLKDVAQFHGQLPVGIYQHIQPRLAALLAAPSAPEGEPHE